jgi:DNA-binding NtrC family response regulator
MTSSPTTISLDLPLREARAVFERLYLAGQIDRAGGNLTRAARAAGMERSAFSRKASGYGITRAPVRRHVKFRLANP